jgi:hypothetical protein
MQGFHVEGPSGSGHQERVGDRVIWESTVSSERFRTIGAEEVEDTSEAIVKGGRIEFFTFFLSDETLDRI